MVVVAKEIESWYLAGIPDDQCRKHRIKKPPRTCDVSKEQFNKLVPKRMTRIEFMQYILDCYCIETGKKTNASLRYLFKKLESEQAI